MKRMTLLFAALTLLIAPTLGSASQSHMFMVEGYVLKFNWHHKLTEEHKDAFEVVGTVTGGDPCKKLEVQVAFSNDHYKDQIPVAKAYIDNYKPDAKDQFRGVVAIQTESKHLPSWGVIDYAVKCKE